MTVRFADHILVDDFASLPAAASTPVGALYSANDTGILYKNNGSSWDVWATLVPPGGATDDHLVKNTDDDYDVGWATPAGGGGGTPLYLLDQQFPGSSLPAGWTFTGSGTCVVSGSKARVTGSAQSDRLMYAYTPTRDNFVLRAHLKLISGAVGMPSLVALDSAGKGIGCGPYNDGSTYGWTMNGTAYQYSGTNVQIDAAQNLTECYLELMVVDGRVTGGAWGTDGIAWVGLNLNAVSHLTITQVGICNILGNSTWDLWDFTITEP